MAMTLQEQAWQSDLVLLDKTWNHNWPPLQCGGRDEHATVVLDHPDTDKDNNNINKRQTVVVLGGYQSGQGELDSVLVLNLADPDKQWREGLPMNQKRYGHAAVVCNGGIYVMGGYNDLSNSTLDCMERIDCNDLSSHESHWTTLTCRLSTPRFGCCAVAVHNRYIVVMGGCDGVEDLMSVDIIDTSNHSVTAGPSMNVPRTYFASAIIGHRIFVIGGRNGDHDDVDDELDSVEYLDCEEERKDDTLSTLISFSSTWTVHSDLVLSNARGSCAVVAVGSCLVVAGGHYNATVEVLDTSRNRVWNLPPLDNHRKDCSLVAVANQVAVIGGWGNPTCATLPLIDKNTWCFRRLCEQPRNEWYHCLEGMGIRDVN